MQKKKIDKRAKKISELDLFQLLLNIECRGFKHWIWYKIIQVIMYTHLSTLFNLSF